MKLSLTPEQQLQLLKSRSLIINDEGVCLDFLKTTGYYRFSGYMRFFQENPAQGLNVFLNGVSFEDIQSIYFMDDEMRGRIFRHLEQVELFLRAQVATLVSDKYGAYEVIFDPRFYVDSATGIPVVDSIGQDVDRSREAYILRYTSAQQSAIGKYNNLPVWVAVEALSFGTLSKIIERGDGGKFQRRLAEAIGVAQGGFASRIKALVYLRNRCAHHSRLWNHSVIDAGATPNNVRFKAKRAYGQFAPRSIVDILASMDDICVRGGFYEPLLPKLSMERNRSEYWQGMTLQPGAAK